MYLYETHLHTTPVSACGRATVRESLEYYKSAGYQGVFITEHFIDSNFDVSARGLPYNERIEHYFSSYEEGAAIGKEIGIDVFSGLEIGQGWTHFLIYGIDKEWCLAHSDMDKMPKRELLPLMMEDGALIIHAHPFREVKTEITLFPRQVHGVEIYNSARNEFENRLAAQYCENYGLIPFAGSDNHVAGAHKAFGGIATERPITGTDDLRELVLSRKTTPFMKIGDKVTLL